MSVVRSRGLVGNIDYREIGLVSELLYPTMASLRDQPVLWLKAMGS